VPISRSSTATIQAAQWVAPRYPKDALQNKVNGDVTLALTLDENGTSKDISVTSGEPEFSQSAIEAVRKWKYAPFTQSGKTAVVGTVVAIHFGITEDGKPDVSAIGTQIVYTDDNVTAPKIVSSVEPEFSAGARAARYQGLCGLALIVADNGTPYDIRVARPLGFGLDEKAVEAVKQWKFAPATKDGKAVPVSLNVEIQFRFFGTP